jgi:hypothetical protein
MVLRTLVEVDIGRMDNWLTIDNWSKSFTMFDQMSHAHFVDLRQLVDYVHALTHISYNFLYSTSCHSDNWAIIKTNLSGVSPACHGGERE